MRRSAALGIGGGASRLIMAASASARGARSAMASLGSGDKWRGMSAARGSRRHRLAA